MSQQQAPTASEAKQRPSTESQGDQVNPPASIKECRLFKTCSANLCPLDQDLSVRSWSIGESVCKSKFHQDLPMIRRQKQLNRRKPEKHMELSLSPDWLVRTAGKLRHLTSEQKARTLSRLTNYGKRPSA
jgi:hypothetical protein